MVVGVNISSFRFKKKNTKKEEFIPFYSDFSKNKKDCAYHCENIIKVIEEFYKSKILPEQLNYHKKYFGTKKDSFKIEEKNDRIYISFTIICGAYGIKSEITDIDTNEILFKRKINNADVKDFRIMFAFAKNQKGFEINKGVILFEVIGQYGVKTLTTNKFREFLSNSFHIIPLFYTISTREAFEKLVENGSFKKINLIKNEEEMTKLIQENNGLIWSIVKRFTGRGYELEDLYQIGMIGFIKSVRNFDINFEVKLSTYAVPYILGEVKRFIRDDGPIKVSRGLKDLNRKIIELQKEWVAKKGREPNLRGNIENFKGSKRRNYISFR